MEGFKRFCLIVFSLVGCAALIVLTLPWVGPWTVLFTSFFSLSWYLFVVELAILLLAIGFVVLFIRGVTMRRHHDVEVLSGEGASITIARSAIASQATYLAEQDGSCVVTKVVVRVRGKNIVDVKVSVQPYQSINVQAEAQVLHARLREGLQQLCGETLNHITIRFLEPRAAGDIDPGPTVEPEAQGDFVPSPIHQVNREIRHEMGGAPIGAPAYSLDSTPTVVVEPSPTASLESDEFTEV